MITLHHLEYSQSFRILWLLEELGAPYELKIYERDPQTRLAPATYKALSPLGTAPVITDDNGLVLAESNAVIDYILDSHPDSPLRPAPGDSSRTDYLFWFHAGVGSLMPMQFFNGLLTMMKDRSPALVRPVIGKATDTVREMLVARSGAQQVDRGRSPDGSGYLHVLFHRVRRCAGAAEGSSQLPAMDGTDARDPLVPACDGEGWTRDVRLQFLGASPGGGCSETRCARPPWCG